MVVEDDRDLAETYRLWLSPLDDIHPIIEQQGERAFQHDLAEIDLIILDRHLPDIPGSEILDRFDRAVPVIVISAYEPDDHIARDDVAAYITKPITKPDLLNALDTVESGVSPRS